MGSLAVGLLTVVLCAKQARFETPERARWIVLLLGLFPFFTYAGFFAFPAWARAALPSAALIFCGFVALGLGSFWAVTPGLLGAALVGFLFWDERRQRGTAAALRAQIEEEESRCNLTIEERTRLEQKEQALLRKKRRFLELREAVRGLSFTTPVSELASQLVLRAAELVEKGEAAFLYLLREDREHFELVARSDLFRAETVPAAWMNLFHEWVLRHRQPLLIEDVEREFRLQFPPALLKEPQFPRSLIAVPLTTEDKILGILSVNSLKKKEFTIEELRLLAILANSAALLLANARLYQETAALANRDGLTRLFAPRYFHAQVEEALEHRNRKAHAFSVLMMDLDHFKSVNDQYGHLVGDALLTSLAQLLRKFAPQEAVLCRYGGEEFTALLPGYSKVEALQLAERLRAEIAQAKLVLRRQEFQVTMSLGVATFPEDGLLRDELMEKADKALYRAKQQGRNKVMCA